jgi:hypothetical protein
MGRAGTDAPGVPGDPSFFAVGRALGARHQMVQRCVERAVAYGSLAALEDHAGLTSFGKFATRGSVAEITGFAEKHRLLSVPKDLDFYFCAFRSSARNFPLELIDQITQIARTI